MTTKETPIDTSDWTWWDFYDLRKVVVENAVGKSMRDRKLIDPVFKVVVSENNCRAQVVDTLNADPRLEQLWLDHIGAVNNCGRACQNVGRRFSKSGGCAVCGAAFVDGVAVKKCADCGAICDALFGPIMGAPEYCRECNEQRRQTSGGPCRMCQRMYWDCCC